MFTGADHLSASSLDILKVAVLSFFSSHVIHTVPLLSVKRWGSAAFIPEGKGNGMISSSEAPASVRPDCLQDDPPMMVKARQKMAVSMCSFFI
jgi:hypothetical protein